MSRTDYGALYLGDTIIIPGRDIEAEVIGFDADYGPSARPDSCSVITDMGRLDGVLSTPVERISKGGSVLPEWADTRQWFSKQDDLIETLANTGALA